MNLKLKVDQQIKEAMLQKEKDKLRALRAIKALILLAETENGVKGELSEETENKLLTKATKQRRDSLALYKEQNREDLAAVEQSELEIIEQFLPKQLATEEVEGVVKNIISEIGATSMQDLGKVMGIAMKKLSGQTDGKVISATAKKLLEG